MRWHDDRADDALSVLEFGSGGTVAGDINLPGLNRSVSAGRAPAVSARGDRGRNRIWFHLRRGGKRLKMGALIID